MLRDKEKTLIALRNEENVMLGHVQRSGQSLTVHCQVVWNDVDLGMVVVTNPWLLIWSFWSGPTYTLYLYLNLLKYIFYYTFSLSLYYEI